MWDGPDVEGLTGWQDDADMSRLIKAIVSRANTMEQATESLAQWAKAQPESLRDEKLKTLFAGVLKTINDDRAVVLAGIERFQRRQKQIAERIQVQGAELGALRARAAVDEKAKAELKAAEDRYNWDTRFFAERQEALPHACEIPVQIEQRAFDLAREIRALMKD
jgi:vacuolar-type H+-ATPase subunit I/STV1